MLSYKTLLACVAFKGAPLEASLFISCILFFFLLLRGHKEYTWKGDAVEDHHFLVSLSRAKRTLYLLVEDLRKGVVLPDGCHLCPDGVYKEYEVKHHCTHKQLRNRLKDGIKALKIVHLVNWLRE